MTINVGSGGGKPPTSLQNNTVVGVAGIQTDMALSMAAVNSAAITSATLTEVLNITGSGVLTFSAISTSSGSTMTSYKITIVIDGVTALSELSGGSTPNTTAHFPAGTYNNDSTEPASSAGQET